MPRAKMCSRSIVGSRCRNREYVQWSIRGKQNGPGRADREVIGPDSVAVCRKGSRCAKKGDLYVLRRPGFVLERRLAQRRLVEISPRGGQDWRRMKRRINLWGWRRPVIVFRRV